MTKRYDTRTIEALLDRIRSEIGDDRFAGMRLMELEKLVRTYDPTNELPGKTLLRATINTFRVARWPSAAPKRLSDRFRW